MDGETPARVEVLEDEPVIVQFQDVTAAAYRIKKCVKETPLEVANNY